MIQNYIRRLYYGLFFLTPLVMNSHTSEIFEFNKMLLIYFFAILISGLWLIQQIMYRNPLHRPRFIIFLLFFLLTQVLSTFFSIDPHTSFYGYYGRFNGGLLSIITYAALFFVFLQVFDKKSLLNLLKVSLLSSVIVILWGLSGKIGYDLSCLVFTGQLTNACWTEQFQPAVRMFSTLGQPNWLGAYLAIHFFIALYFIFEKNTKKIGHARWSSLYSIYLLFNFVSILFTRSRSSLFAVVIGMITFMALSLMTKKIEIKSFLTKGKIALGIVLLFSVILFKTGIPKVDKYLSLPSRNTQVDVKQSTQSQNSGSNVTDSFDIRKIVWKGAFTLGQKYPIFGTGVETFAYSYYFARPIEHNYTSEWDFIYNKAHNEYLNYFATTGYLGLVSYLFLIGAVVYVYGTFIFNKKNNANEALLCISLTASYITILTTNFFGFSTTTINLFFFIIPAIPFLNLKESQVNDPSQVKLPWWKYGLTGLVIVGMFILSFRITNYLRADVTYAKGLQLMSSGDYQSALSLLDDALKLKYEHVYEDKMSIVLANLAYVASDQKEKKLRDSLIRLSQAYNSKALLAASKNVLYWKTRAKNEYLFYQSTQDKNYLIKATQALDIAKSLAPTDPKLPYSQALFYSNLAEVSSSDKQKYKAKAFSEINLAMKLKPDFKDAYELKGQLLKK